MASAALATAAAPVNGTSSPLLAENAELYAQLLRLRDVVLAGKHASIKLPAPAIERLKASLLESDALPLGGQHALLNSAVNGTALSTNPRHPQHVSPYPPLNDLPALQTASAALTNGSSHVHGAKPATAAASELDPIFLQKADVVIRAEGQLKRQRLDRDLQSQVDQRKHSSRDRDPGLEASSPIDIDAVLLSALARVKPVSGLRDTDKSGASSSFDENDYYSSQVQSDWSSEASASKASDKATGAFTADFEPLDGAPPPPSSTFMSSAKRSSHRKESSIPAASVQLSATERRHVYTNVPEEAYEVGDEDDEYTPPDAAAFDNFREDRANMAAGQVTPPDDDDNSEYEPGEITDSNVPTPQNVVQQPSPRVPVIRNHLTHIVAPQPNRVSPLAMAKGPSYELELVNGRPEMVQKPRPQQNNLHSRASTASPSGNGVGGSGKKRRNKKRKRDAEPPGRAKRRHKQAPLAPHAASTYGEPYIKDEPTSPPPFANLQDVPAYNQPQAQQRPVDVDLSSPRYAPQIQYAPEPLSSGLRYENMQPTSPTFVQVAPPPTQRLLQRDNQDLRRVASLHYAQRPASPQRNEYTPVGPYRTVSMPYDEHASRTQVRPANEHGPPKQTVPEPSYNARSERSRSPPRDPEYRHSYAARAQSPAMMAPPAAPSRKIIVDQNGNRYYAAELAATSVSRASAAPIERAQPPVLSHERRSSQPGFTYDQVVPTQTTHYEMRDTRSVAPPPLNRRQAGQPLFEPYTSQGEANAYQFQDYNLRSAEATRYTQPPTSPVYQPVRGHEQMLPPPRQQPGPAMETAPSVYTPARSYSVRPDEPQQVPQGSASYLRHASVAPVQYVRQDAPPPPIRAISVMPSGDYGSGAGLLQQQQQPPAQQQRTFSQAPQGVRYVDQYGNEVFPREVREVRY